MSECLECQDPPSRLWEGKARLPVTQPSIEMKQKEYTVHAPFYEKERQLFPWLGGKFCRIQVWSVEGPCVWRKLCS